MGVGVPKFDCMVVRGASIVASVDRISREGVYGVHVLSVIPNAADFLDVEVLGVRFFDGCSSEVYHGVVCLNVLGKKIDRNWR